MSKDLKIGDRRLPEAFLSVLKQFCVFFNQKLTARVASLSFINVSIFSTINFKILKYNPKYEHVPNHSSLNYYIVVEVIDDQSTVKYIFFRDMKHFKSTPVG